MLVNEKTWEYIRQHRQDDVRTLALRGAKDAEVDLTLALQQIAGWQTARRKLPSWSAHEGIVYPPHLNMEQCSSEQTARYKAAIAGHGRRMVDLTGGLGVDFYFIAQGFQDRCYVEQDAGLCNLAEANMRALSFPCSVSCADSVAYLATMEKADLVYLDPARRNEHGARTYGIEDCTPNVLELLPLLAGKASRILLKLSPMLDWHQAVAQINHPLPNADRSPSWTVSEVHIVSVDNECKELLLVLRPVGTEDLRLFCVNNGQVFQCPLEFARGERLVCLGQTPRLLGANDLLAPGTFLYEPHASIMKAGCFDALTARFAVTPIADNSHLFLSAGEIADFPGRRFQIQAISSMNRQELKQLFNESLMPLKSANISVRNFPLSAEQLRKKLKLKDGGDTYIFATTTQDGSHRLLICRKIS